MGLLNDKANILYKSQKNLEINNFFCHKKQIIICYYYKLNTFGVLKKIIFFNIYTYIYIYIW